MRSVLFVIFLLLFVSLGAGANHVEDDSRRIFATTLDGPGTAVFRIRLDASHMEPVLTFGGPAYGATFHGAWGGGSEGSALLFQLFEIVGEEAHPITLSRAVQPAWLHSFPTIWLTTKEAHGLDLIVVVATDSPTPIDFLFAPATAPGYAPVSGPALTGGTPALAFRGRSWNHEVSETRAYTPVAPGADMWSGALHADLRIDSPGWHSFQMMVQSEGAGLVRNQVQQDETRTRDAGHYWGVPIPPSLSVGQSIQRSDAGPLKERLSLDLSWEGIHMGSDDVHLEAVALPLDLSPLGLKFMEGSDGARAVAWDEVLCPAGDDLPWSPC